MNALRRWFERKRVEASLAEEMQAHLEEKVDALVEQGMTEDEARSKVRRQFGNVTLYGEKSRENWGWNGLEQFVNDVRFGCRLLMKAPSFTATALLTLALGIGASTAVFTLIDSVILKPLTYRNSGELVVAWERVLFLSHDGIGPNPRHVDIWRTGATTFQGMTLLQEGADGVTLGAEHPRVAGVVLAETNLFDVLQVTPLLGRTFRREDATTAGSNVAILTFSLWQELFQGTSTALGKMIKVSGRECEVIGILPESFRFPHQSSLHALGSEQGIGGSNHASQLFVPTVIDFSKIDWGGGYGNWIVVGRLKPGVGLAQASAQLDSLEARVIAQEPVSERERRAKANTLHAFVEPMHEVVVGGSGTTLWLLMAAVAGLLLVACLNLANAQLGRAVLRIREVALRSALGASKWRLLSSAFAESVVLAGLGGAGGVLLAIGATKLLQRYSPIDLPRLAELNVNTTVLVFSAGVTLGCCLLFGMIPAFKMIFNDPQTALQQNNNRAVGRSQGRQLRTLIIGLQVVGCTVLLLLTGLFTKSLFHLLYQEKGFETKKVAVAEVDLYDNAYEEKNRRVEFDDTILQKLRAMPGVESAGLISSMPLEGERWIESLQRTDQPRQKTPLVNLRWVSPGYFETMRERLVAGRFFEERDKNLNSIVLSEAEALVLWPSAREALAGQVKVEEREFAVIGIVADSRNTSLKSAPAKMAYAHYKGRPPFSTFFVVRGRDASDMLLSNIRQAIWTEAPAVTIARIKTLDSQLTDSVAGERFETFVLMAFAGAALLLAVLGIYGVLNYSMASRRQEIGVRMALGATNLGIYSLALREGGVAVAVGIALGIAVSLPLSRYIEAMLYGVRPIDISIISIVAIVLLSVALIATFLPMRRAASVNPMDALRSE